MSVGRIKGRGTAQERAKKKKRKEKKRNIAKGEEGKAQRRRQGKGQWLLCQCVLHQPRRIRVELLACVLLDVSHAAPRPTKRERGGFERHAEHM